MWAARTTAESCSACRQRCASVGEASLRLLSVSRVLCLCLPGSWVWWGTLWWLLVTNLRIYGFTDPPPSLPVPRPGRETPIRESSWCRILNDTPPPRAPRPGPPRPSLASGGPPAAARCGGVTNPTSVHRDAIGRSEVQLGAWIARPGLSPGPLNGRLRCRPHEVLFTPVQPFVQHALCVAGSKLK